MSEETFPLLRRAPISAGCANLLYDEEINNPDGTPYDFTGFVWECEIRTVAASSGVKLVQAAVTIVANRITISIDVAQSNAVVSGALNRQAYADLLFAASSEEEPQKWASLTLPASGTATIWGAGVAP